MPRFSIFTPTHDTTYLHDLHRSLLAQTFTDWEWVLLPNNGAVIPEDIAGDPKVRWVGGGIEDKVGALKKMVCEACRGDYLVEVDHDDSLLPHALQEIDRAIKEHDPDFLYSDFINLKPDGSCEVYGKDWGWESYEYDIGGLKLTAMSAFEPTPSTLREIFYAPNHVRVWRNERYMGIGGHDTTMRICDDQELVQRTYLSGAEFHHIKSPLYLYRIREDRGNTFLTRNAEIQKEQAKLSRTNTSSLIYEWCRRNDLKMLDLGGATGKPEGYWSVDLKNADILADVRDRLPFEDGTVGCVRAVDFLEHIPHCADSRCQHGADGNLRCVVGVMNEIYRVLAPGGWLLSITPSSDGRGAFQDPTHCSFWNPNSFWYYTRRQQAQYVRGIECRFRAADVYQDFPSDWHKQHNIPYVYANLVALKGQREPGLIEI